MSSISALGRDELIADLQAHIKELARERNAVILSHNYERAEVQDVADFVGDSLGLSREAARTTADVIVFCGVHFMAETAAILSPHKMVLLPDLAAGCSLASSIDAKELRAWKAEHAKAVVVSYVNTTAEVKAESDYCCTSGNAVEVVNSIPAEQEILFLPDMFLGAHVRRMTKRENIHVWLGECHVHAGIDPENIRLQRGLHPGVSRSPGVWLLNQRPRRHLRRRHRSRGRADPFNGRHDKAAGAVQGRRVHRCH
jgi:quinolinate synthase